MDEAEAGVHPLPAEVNGTESANSASLQGNGFSGSVAQSPETHPPADQTGQARDVKPPRISFRAIAISVVVVLASGATSAFFLYRSNRPNNHAPIAPHAGSLLSPPSGHALPPTAGAGTAPYVARPPPTPPTYPLS